MEKGKEASSPAITMDVAGDQKPHTTTTINWTDAVDDLVDNGNVEGAISLLESVVSRLETLETTADLPLASALGDLANLHSSRGHSLIADDLRSRSLLIRARAEEPSFSRDSEGVKEKAPERRDLEAPVSQSQEDDDDDWEAAADRGPPDIGIISSAREDATDFDSHTGCGMPKRRGRGSFLYKKNELYSDLVNANDHFDMEEDSSRRSIREEESELGKRKFGTRHLLALYDFPPTMRTMDLEKLFQSYGDSSVAIQWVNDTCAVAVFQTPSAASKAQNSICFPFKVRNIDEDDVILNRLSAKDLEPPHPRPKTSARAAHRMITQVMGIKPSLEFTSNALRKEDQARKDRIHTRQSMKNDAWGSDDP